MEVYMFQQLYENFDDEDFDTKEELFYTEEDALEYMKIAIEEELKIIKDIYCGDDEDVEDYCEITELSYSHVTIYIEDELWTSFAVYKKQMMSFGK